MRVIAGTAKGRKLRSTSSARPMTDQIREALFSTLGDISGMRFLDLYAGSGAVGVEALSRGAAMVTFVENDRVAIDDIEHNLDVTGQAERAEVVHADVERYVSRRGRQYGVVVVDPPFGIGLPSRVISSVAESDLAGPSTTVVVRVSSRQEANLPPGYEMISRRRYGDSTILYLTPSGSG